jgi:WD40 repeat protein
MGPAAVPLRVTRYEARIGWPPTRRRLSPTHSIRIRDLVTDATTTVIDTDNYLTAADGFPDGKRLAVLTDKGLELFTLQEGAEPTRQMLKSGSAIKDVDVSPDGSAIAYCINGQRSIFVMTGF